MPRPRRGPSRLHLFLVRLVKGVAIGMSLLALALSSAYVAMRVVMEKRRVEVPSVVGLESVAASALIREAGLAPRVVAEEFSQRIPKGHVTSQRPAQGTRATLGSEVRLFLSRGTDQLEVPSVAGNTLPQAQRILAEAGLSLGSILRIHSDVHAREAIIAQHPPARPGNGHGPQSLEGTAGRGPDQFRPVRFAPGDGGGAGSRGRGQGEGGRPGADHRRRITPPGRRRGMTTCRKGVWRHIPEEDPW